MAASLTPRTPATPPRPGVPAAAPPAPAPSRALALAVVGAAALVTAMQVVEAVVAHRVGGRFLAALGDGRDPQAAFATYDLVGGAVAVAQLATIVLTGFWLLRMRRFVERVNPAFPHHRRRWWAFGGWVIPFACLAVPFQYVRDLRGSLGQQLARRPVPVGAWWTFLLLSELVDRAAVRGLLGARDGQTAADLGLVETAQLAFCVPALVLWFVVVTRLTDATG